MVSVASYNKPIQHPAKHFRLSPELPLVDLPVPHKVAQSALGRAGREPSPQAFEVPLLLGFLDAFWSLPDVVLFCLVLESMISFTTSLLGLFHH